MTPSEKRRQYLIKRLTELKIVAITDSLAELERVYIIARCKQAKELERG